MNDEVRYIRERLSPSELRIIANSGGRITRKEAEVIALDDQQMAKVERICHKTIEKYRTAMLVELAKVYKQKDHPRKTELELLRMAIDELLELRLRVRMLKMTVASQSKAKPARAKAA